MIIKHILREYEGEALTPQIQELIKHFLRNSDLDRLTPDELERIRIIIDDTQEKKLSLREKIKKYFTLTEHDKARNAYYRSALGFKSIWSPYGDSGEAEAQEHAQKIIERLKETNIKKT